MAHQLDVWRGRFGREYTDRNVVAWRSRVPAFREALAGLSIRRVLEVGCNRAHNLVALAELLGVDAQIVGIEPNRYALERGRAAHARAAILQGAGFDLPFHDRAFDLVFTAGVLIHVPLDSLPQALAEMHRVSRRYLLAVEYFGEQETPVPYRGEEGLLWRRDFPTHFRSQFPDLGLVRSGFWDQALGFDRTTWWLFEKAAGRKGRG